MQRMKITAGHQQVMPYSMLRDADQFIDFARQLFHAEEQVRVLDADRKIEHSEIKIGDSMILLAEATPTLIKPGALYIYVKDADQTYYDALDAGSKSLMQPIDEDNGARSAGFEDPFGNTWWIATLN